MVIREKLLKVRLSCSDIYYHVTSGSTCSLPAENNSGWIQVFNVSLNHEICLQNTQHSNVEPGFSTQSVRVRCHFLSNYYAALCWIAGWLAGWIGSQLARSRGACVNPAHPGLSGMAELRQCDHSRLQALILALEVVLSRSPWYSLKKKLKRKKKHFPYLKRSFVSYLKKSMQIVVSFECNNKARLTSGHPRTSEYQKSPF